MRGGDKGHHVRSKLEAEGLRAVSDEIVRCSVGNEARRRRHGSILIVAGDNECRSVFKRLTRCWEGLTLLIAEGGAAAGYHMALSRRPRLVVVDSGLPDRDAETIVRALTENSRSSKAAIIVVGSDDSGREAADFIESGADAYLTKPLSADSVGPIVIDLLALAATR